MIDHEVTQVSSETTSETTSEAFSEKPSRILVVGDESIIGLPLEQVLVNLGYEVAGPVASGEAALRSVEKHLPDLVLMDVQLAGEMDGIETAARIRERLDLPIIYLTARPERLVMEDVRQTEPYGFLFKPVRAKELGATVEMALYRYRMDAKLRESEGRLRRLLESTSDLIFLQDIEGRYLYYNGARDDGLEVRDVVGTTPSDWFSPQVAERLVERIRRVATDGEEVTVEQCLDWEGETRWFQESMFPVRDEAGDIVAVGTISRDITAHKRAEVGRGGPSEEMRSAAKDIPSANILLRTLLETMPVGVVVWDDQGDILMQNEQGQFILGERGEGDVGHARREYTPYYPDGTPFSLHEMPQSHALESGEVVRDVEIRIRRADGEERAILVGTTPVRDEAGRIIGGVTVCQDITREKWAEKALRQSERRYRSLYTAMNEGVVLNELVYDKAGQPVEYVIMDANPMFETMTGLDVQAVVGRAASEVYGVDEAPFLELFAQVVETGEPISFDAHVPSMGKHFYISAYRPDQGQFAVVFTDVTARIEVEADRERLIAQLSQERALLAVVIENAPGGIVVADGEGHILRANPAAERLYGGDVPYGEDVEPHGELAFCYSDGTPYAPQDLPLSRSAQAGEVFKNIEMVVIWPDGQRRDLLMSSAPIQDAAGRRLGAVGVLQDITTQKQVEERLQVYAGRVHVLHETGQTLLAARSLEEMVRATLAQVPHLLECVHIGVTLYDVGQGWVIQLAGQIDSQFDLARAQYDAADPAWKVIVEGIGQGKTHVVEDVSQFSPSSVFVETLQEEGVRALTVIPLVIEDRLIGSLNVGLARRGRLRDEEMEAVNELVTLLVIGLHQIRLQERVRQHTEDLERRVDRRTAQLRASEARFRAIFESAGVGIARIDREGCFEDCNPALQEMLGYDEKALRGRHVLTLAYDGGDADGNTEGDEGEAQFEALLRGEVDRCVMERRYTCGDERTIWAHWTLSGVRPRRGRGIRFAIGMMEDITERKEAQAALIQAEKLTLAGRLAASFAHEINNPLQSVIGFLGLARESLEAGEEIGHFLDIGLEELRRASDVVGQLRNLHHTSEPVERELTDVNGLLEQMIAVSGNRCAKSGVEVVWEPGDDLPTAMLAEDRIKQVFLNLILNGVDAMPDGGELWISTEYDPSAGGLEIHFVDNGVGIPEHILDHIFDPFYTTKEEGMGMGLFVSQRIVENHGGRIVVESEVGAGTRFTVWLPVT